MAQHSNEHLTITELSAYIDQELTPEELALYDAHIQTCQPCQAALADLQLTSTLLASMPQAAVPRSFTLPSNLVLLPETPAITQMKTPVRTSASHFSIWKRSLSAASTLVALLGLVLFLSGVLPNLSHGSVTTTSAGSAAAAPKEIGAPLAPTAYASNGSQAEPTKPDATATYQAATMTSAKAQLTSTATNASTSPEREPPGVPAILDPGQTEGRLTIGSALLLLGILGALSARQRNRATRSRT